MRSIFMGIVYFGHLSHATPKPMPTQSTIPSATTPINKAPKIASNVMAFQR